MALIGYTTEPIDNWFDINTKIKGLGKFPGVGTISVTSISAWLLIASPQQVKLAIYEGDLEPENLVVQAPMYTESGVSA
ncbi:unnamed protein product, partial [marine sediment metagenome]